MDTPIVGPMTLEVMIRPWQFDGQWHHLVIVVPRCPPEDAAVVAEWMTEEERAGVVLQNLERQEMPSIYLDGERVTDVAKLAIYARTLDLFEIDPHWRAMLEE